MQLAPQADVQAAAAAVNHVLSHTRLAAGCKIEIGLALVLTGLEELPRRLRGSIVSVILSRLTGRIAAAAGKHIGFIPKSASLSTLDVAAPGAGMTLH